MNVDANRDQERVTVLVEHDDVTVIATAQRDVDDADLLEALSLADEQLEHGLAVPVDDARRRGRQHAADGGRA
ncbi:hypothetical protein [Halorubellus salinus]|uniref:hypothetical protein n=1 Tax=Halorubellus salinus TaxID=755309 RepID=UPI001D084786|nr:hypothetical protein [Halorubellus salinus]